MEQNPSSAPQTSPEPPTIVVQSTQPNVESGETTRTRPSSLDDNYNTEDNVSPVAASAPWLDMLPSAVASTNTTISDDLLISNAPGSGISEFHRDSRRPAEGVELNLIQPPGDLESALSPPITIASSPSSERPTPSTEGTRREPEATNGWKSHILPRIRTLSGLVVEHASSEREQPKIAIKRGLRGNWYRFLPHIAAASATAAVVQLSFRNVYWMDLQPPGKKVTPGLTQGGALNFLQLAAKLHELLILASISGIVLHVALYHLITGKNGLPLSLLANPFELGSAQFLRRKSFWIALWSPFKLFWLLSFVSTIMVILSGPSSAIAVIPRLDFFDIPHPFEETVLPYYIWNHTMDLWPQQLNASSLPDREFGTDPDWCISPLTVITDRECPSGGQRILKDWALSMLFADTEAGSNVTFRDINANSQRTMHVKSCESNFDGRASGTSLNTFTTRAIIGYWKYMQSNAHGVVVTAAQPHLALDPGTIRAPQVETICKYYANDNFDGSNPEVQPSMVFPGLNSDVSVPIPDWAYRFPRQLSMPNFTYIELSEYGSLAPSLGALLTLPLLHARERVNETELIGLKQTSAFMACSIYTQWSPVNVWYQPTLEDQPSYSVSTSLPGTCLATTQGNKPSLKPINVTMDARYTMAMNQPANFTYLSDGKERTTGLPDGIYPNILGLMVNLSFNNSYIPHGVRFIGTPHLNDSSLPEGVNIGNETRAKDAGKYISTFITGLVTDALARHAANGIDSWSGAIFLPPDRSENGSMYGISPQSTSGDGSNGTLWEVDNSLSNEENARHRLLLEFKFKRFGYGYSWSGSPTAQFGISVLLVHTTIAILYTLYLLGYFVRKWNGGLPRSWETIPEMLVLAVNSGRSEKLENTCSGIKRKETWGVPVAVRETGVGDHLEIVAGKEEMDQLMKARVGVHYG